MEKAQADPKIIDDAKGDWLGGLLTGFPSQCLQFQMFHKHTMPCGSCILCARGMRLSYIELENVIFLSSKFLIRQVVGKKVFFRVARRTSTEMYFGTLVMSSGCRMCQLITLNTCRLCARREPEEVCKSRQNTKAADVKIKSDKPM